MTRMTMDSYKDMKELLEILEKSVFGYTDTQPISTSEEMEIVALEPNPNVPKFIKSSKQVKCECGAEKCGFNNHSDYCPKYNK